MHSNLRRQSARNNSCHRQPPGGSSCKAGLEPPSLDLNVSLLHLNLHGFLSHQAELEYQLQHHHFPDLVGITESFLDKSVHKVILCGYTMISRLDRRDGRQQGGIIMFAKDAIADQIHTHTL